MPVDASWGDPGNPGKTIKEDLLASGLPQAEVYNRKREKHSIDKCVTLYIGKDTLTRR